MFVNQLEKITFEANAKVKQLIYLIIVRLIYNVFKNMTKQLNKNNRHLLTQKIIEDLTESHKKFCQKLNKRLEHQQKLEKIVEIKVSQSNMKSFIEFSIWKLRNYKKMGSPANITQSSKFKAFDHLFYKSTSKKRQVGYFEFIKFNDTFK